MTAPTSYAIGTRHAALCADGVTRSALVVNYPDTFFSVPARITVRGKTVTGFVCTVGIGEEAHLTFSADSWRKNAACLPNWPEKCRNCHGIGTKLPEVYTGVEERVTCMECGGARQRVYPRS